MYNYMDSFNPYIASFYFCLLIIFGNYFFLNLVLAVIIDAFNECDVKEKKKEQLQREREAELIKEKFDALKSIFRMIRLTEKKIELYRLANKEY